MAKKKKKTPATGKKSKHRFSNAQREAPVEKPSVFEARSGRLKFDVLGKKTRGVKGDALKARTAGTLKRKNTLLKEYHASGKANAFVDRRFGEGDVDMTPDERAIGRLARARMGQLKPSGRKQSFALGDEETNYSYDDDGGHFDDDTNTQTDKLTHGGAPIDARKEERRSAHALARGASRRRGDESDSEDDRLGGGLGRDATAAMHFGGGDEDDETGGFSLKRGDHDADEPERRKTKKEVMEELIAKSKQGKATRARQREADEDLLDKLDDEFRKISDSGVFNAALSKGVGHLKPDGWERGGSRRKNGDNDEKNKNRNSFGFKELEAVTLARTATDHAGEQVKDDYDKLTRELGLEARGQAVDRTKTAEEIEAAEAAELESQERNRLKRARGDSDSEDDLDDKKLGGFAARRAKAKKQEAKQAAREARGGEGSDDSDSDDSDVDLSDKKPKRKSGDDLDGNWDLDPSDGEDDDASNGSESESEEDDDSNPDDDLDETALLKKQLKTMRPDLEAGKARLRKLGILNDGGATEVEAGAEKSGEESKEESEEEETPVPAPKPSKRSVTEKKDTKEKDTPKEDDHLPFVFSMPETSAQLDKILKGLTPDETATVLDRIRKLHAPSLKEENRKLTQTFLGLLLKKFETLAGESPLPVAYLDSVVSVISPVATSVPFFAATAARVRLEKMSTRLRQSLRSDETGWPPARTFLLLSLFADIFPPTDKQHPVTTPAALYIGNVLAHCAVRSRREAVVAVCFSSLAAAYSVPSGRIFPEAVGLLTGLVHAAGGGAKSNWSQGLSTHLREQVGGAWLGLFDVDAKTGSGVAEGKKKETSDSMASETVPLSLPAMLAAFGLAGASHEPNWLPNGSSDRQSVLLAALSTLRQLIKPCLKTPSARELLGPVKIAVEMILHSIEVPKKKSKKDATDSSSLRSACEALLGDIEPSLSQSSKRPPLRWRTKSTDQIKQFNPMYEEEGYQKGRDYDPNRERAEKRRLQRQVKQEARGAVRELRKDNKFLAEQRNAEQSMAKEERGEKQKETLAFLEKMEGDLKSGGQGGVIVKTQRRVNGGKGRDRKKR
tara:strand:+ start:30128 stop:33343 length:3216 start_codon:yes stop_codon:yes gene_type:complete